MQMKMAGNSFFDIRRFHNEVVVFVDVLFFDFSKLCPFFLCDFVFFHAPFWDYHLVPGGDSVVRKLIRNDGPVCKSLKVRGRAKFAGAGKPTCRTIVHISFCAFF